MKRLLVPLDNNLERAMRQAEYVTNIPCASEQVDSILAHTFTGEERSVSKDMQRPNRVETVRRAKERLEEEDIAVETQEISSPPANGIIELAEEQGIDHIVMGGRKRSPTEKAILGSTTQKVILNADIPVTVAGGK